MHMRKTLVVAAALFALSPLAAQAANLNSKGLEVSGWLPYWRSASSTLDVMPHLRQLTEINPFVYVVQPDGTIQDMAGVADDPWKSLFVEARKNKVRVIPTVMWSDTTAIHAILSNATKRQALEDTITSVIKGEGFDGVDIDFEGKSAMDKDYFSTFLKGLYQRMGTKWVMCTIEARTPIADRYPSGNAPKDATTYANDFVQINKYCDRVRFMTYDQQTVDVALNQKQGSAPYVPIADPKWVEDAIRLAMQSISKNKIEIGVATYGYEWTVTPLSQSGYNYDLQWAFNPRYATDLAAQIGAKIQRNSAGELSFSYLPQIQTPPPPKEDQQLSNANSDVTPIPAPLQTTTPAAVALANASINILWWSDAQAIADKVALAKKLGIRGVSVFKMDGGEDQGMWAVLK